ARYLKRVPDLEEALQFIQDKRLFTGNWAYNEAGRRRRVRDLVHFVSETFDPGKCKNGSVNVSKYEAWAFKNFPRGFVGKTRPSMTEEGEIIDGPHVYVNPGFIAVFLSVCEFALVANKNLDDSLPHARAQELWESLREKRLVAVPFCARKWAVCREKLVRYGMVRITDRDYGPGKAMKWALGPYFPFLGLWKTPKVKSLG